MSRRAMAVLLAAAAAAACRHAQRASAPEVPAPRAQARAAPRPAPGHPPVPASPQGLVGADAVRDLQRALVQHGYLKEPHREGELDAPTSAAVGRFQQDRGLAATGFPDRETLQELGVDPEKAFSGAPGSRER